LSAGVLDPLQKLTALLRLPSPSWFRETGEKERGLRREKEKKREKVKGRKGVS